MICELLYSVVVCPAAAAIVARRMDDFISFALCTDVLFSYRWRSQICSRPHSHVPLGTQVGKKRLCWRIRSFLAERSNATQSSGVTQGGAEEHQLVFTRSQLFRSALTEKSQLSDSTADSQSINRTHFLIEAISESAARSSAGTNW